MWGTFLQHTPPEATSSQNSGLLHSLFHKIQQTTAVLQRYKYSSSDVFSGDNADKPICHAKLIQLYLSVSTPSVSSDCLKWNLSPKAFHVYRVSQEECVILRESVPYVKLYRYNPKHLYPKLNGYGDNGQRSLKL